MKRAAVTVFFLAACFNKTAVPPTKTAQTAPTAAASSRAAADAPLPKSYDVRADLMGWVVIDGGERVLRQLASEPERSADLKTLQRSFANSFGVDPILAEVIALERPAAVALLNPTLLTREGARPYMAMVPVRPRAEVEAVFERHKVPIERTPWGFTVMSQKGKLYVAFRDGYALVAWRDDLLGAAHEVLAPKLAGRHDAPIEVHVKMDNVYAAFGPQIETAAKQFATLAGQGGTSGDPQVAWALRGLKSLSHYVGSVADLALLVDLDSGGLTLTARVDGKPEGAFAGFVASQRPGPSWGTQYLPSDAVLVYTTHLDGEAGDVDAAVEYLIGAVPSKTPDADQAQRVRRALEGAATHASGDLAYAVWPGRGGGVGLGGAYRVRHPGEARAAVMAVYDAIGAQLGGVVARALMFDPARFASRFAAHKRVTRVGDVDVDLLEVTARWPKRAQAERRVFETMFGPRLVMATAFVGDQALFTIGDDWQPRLEAMISTAQGHPAASMNDDPTFAEAQRARDGQRVSMSYLETGRMATLAAGLLAESSDLDERQRAAVTAAMAQVGRGAIVTTTQAQGRRWELTTHVPASAIAGAARLNGALWRVALSPLLNPPMMPPMPIPPPHVTPSAQPLDAAPAL